VSLSTLATGIVLSFHVDDATGVRRRVLGGPMSKEQRG
jgi:hypothetical protein